MTLYLPVISVAPTTQAPPVPPLPLPDPQRDTPPSLSRARPQSHSVPTAAPTAVAAAPAAERVAPTAAPNDPAPNDPATGEPAAGEPAVVPDDPAAVAPVPDGPPQDESTDDAAASVPAAGAEAGAPEPQPTSELVDGVDLFASPVGPPSTGGPTADAAPADAIPAGAASTGEAGRWMWPVRGEISQFFSGEHHALDVVAAHGALVVAADGGEVVYAEWEISGYGYLVIVDHGDGYRTYYGHLYGFYVDVGEQVDRGDLIGQLGNTGHSTGPHLHFEIRYRDIAHDPLEWLPAAPSAGRDDPLSGQR